MSESGYSESIFYCKLPVMERDQLYKALLSRDHRYDGRFYFGVTTTGIYCRPICPAKPKLKNLLFYKSKAEAESAGFRPCMRCRPDLSPLSPQWKGTGGIISRALALVEKGNLQGRGLADIADQLGMTDRHLRRLFQDHIGASPIAFAISRRLHLARQLLVQTDLSVLDIATAAGFSSLRRFNDAFSKTYKMPPMNFRKENSSPSLKSDFLTIELPYTPPMDWAGLMHFFQRHGVYGLEVFENDSYARHFKTSNGLNFFRVRHESEKERLKVEIKVAHLSDLAPTIEKIRCQFDLAHNPHHIDIPKSLIKKHPDLIQETRAARVPGGFDSFEIAISIILGQLVSVEQAKNNVRKLVERFGEKTKSSFHQSLTHLFPTPKILKDADFEGLGFTKARVHAIKELSRQVFCGEIQLDRACDLQTTRSQLLAIKGIGPWTVEMMALRCLADTDAFPAKDLIIERALQTFELDSTEISPWKAYLTLAIWKTQAHLLTKKRMRTS
jgi:AraC family transcriptional regulator, regulatory protein of adaptative response / DNA-3-methyladenine glycosylase II